MAVAAGKTAYWIPLTVCTVYGTNDPALDHRCISCVSVSNVLSATSPATTEIVIWNNGSTDGTREYLDTHRGKGRPAVRARSPLGCSTTVSAASVKDIESLGYGAAVLADLKVHHTGGEHYGVNNAEKERFWAFYWKKQARRAAIKRLVFRLPFFRRLNARFDWFVAPS